MQTKEIGYAEYRKRHIGGSFDSDDDEAPGGLGWAGWLTVIASGIIVLGAVARLVSGLGSNS